MCIRDSWSTSQIYKTKPTNTPDKRDIVGALSQNNELLKRAEESGLLQHSEAQDNISQVATEEDSTEKVYNLYVLACLRGLNKRKG